MTEKQKFKIYLKEQVEKGLLDFKVDWTDEGLGLSEEKRYKALNEAIDAPTVCDQEVLGQQCCGGSCGR